mmetsp:Transcript_70841/g.125087  ORF Transcript_70841/g.125087 Transcript_70841/m.125087 type:complete len:999 (-) Transcript_70841:241-3237(-)
MSQKEAAGVRQRQTSSNGSGFKIPKHLKDMLAELHEGPRPLLFESEMAEDEESSESECSESFTELVERPEEVTRPKERRISTQLAEEVERTAAPGQALLAADARKLHRGPHAHKSNQKEKQTQFFFRSDSHGSFPAAIRTELQVKFSALDSSHQEMRGAQGQGRKRHVSRRKRPKPHHSKDPELPASYGSFGRSKPAPLDVVEEIPLDSFAGVLMENTGRARTPRAILGMLTPTPRARRLHPTPNSHAKPVQVISPMMISNMTQRPAKITDAELLAIPSPIPSFYDAALDAALHELAEPIAAPSSPSWRRKKKSSKEKPTPDRLDVSRDLQVQRIMSDSSAQITVSAEMSQMLEATFLALDEDAEDAEEEAADVQTEVLLPSKDEAPVEAEQLWVEAEQAVDDGDAFPDASSSDQEHDGREIVHRKDSKEKQIQRAATFERDLEEISWKIQSQESEKPKGSESDEPWEYLQGQNDQAETQQEQEITDMNAPLEMQAGESENERFQELEQDLQAGQVLPELQGLEELPEPEVQEEPHAAPEVEEMRLAQEQYDTEHEQPPSSPTSPTPSPSPTFFTEFHEKSLDRWEAEPDPWGSESRWSDDRSPTPDQGDAVADADEYLKPEDLVPEMPRLNAAQRETQRLVQNTPEAFFPRQTSTPIADFLIAQQHEPVQEQAQPQEKQDSYATLFPSIPLPPLPSLEDVHQRFDALATWAMNSPFPDDREGEAYELAEERFKTPRAKQGSEPITNMDSKLAATVKALRRVPAIHDIRRPPSSLSKQRPSRRRYSPPRPLPPRAQSPACCTVAGAPVSPVPPQEREHLETLTIPPLQRGIEEREPRACTALGTSLLCMLPPARVSHPKALAQAYGSHTQILRAPRKRNGHTLEQLTLMKSQLEEQHLGTEPQQLPEGDNAYDNLLEDFMESAAEIEASEMADGASLFHLDQIQSSRSLDIRFPTEVLPTVARSGTQLSYLTSNPTPTSCHTTPMPEGYALLSPSPEA